MKYQIKVVSGNYSPKRCGLSHYVQHLNGHLKEKYNITLLMKADAIKKWDMKAVLDLAVYLRKDMEAIDLLHIHHSAASYDFNRSIFLLPLLARMMGFDRPIVTTVHEYGNWEDNFLLPPGIAEWAKETGQRYGVWDREDGFLLTLSNAVVCTNEETEKLLRDRLHSEKPVVRIPITSSIEVVNVGKDKARRILSEQIPIPERAPLFVHFGLLHPLKGLETLIVAFSKVIRHLPDARLLLLGNDESNAFYGTEARRYRQKLRAFIADLKLSDRIYLTGYLPDDTVSTYLTAADIGVLPGANGISLKNSALLTMLSHHLPVISTCALPSQRFLEMSHILSMVPVGDTERLADEMITLYQDFNRQDVFRQRAGAVSRIYNWENITTQYESLYERLMGNHYEKNRFTDGISRFQTVLPEKG